MKTLTATAQLRVRVQVRAGCSDSKYLQVNCDEVTASESCKAYFARFDSCMDKGGSWDECTDQALETLPTGGKSNVTKLF